MDQEYHDFLIWVGGQHYPSVDAYVVEAERQGISRRIPFYMEDLAPGKSRIYLAHQQREDIMEREAPEIFALKPYKRVHVLSLARKVLDGKIDPKDVPEKLSPFIEPGIEYINKKNDSRVLFGYYTMQSVEYCVDAKMDEKIKELVRKGLVTEVSKAVWSAEPLRGCGKRKPGLYVVAYVATDLKTLVDAGIDVSKIDIKGPLVAFNEFVPVDDFCPGRRPNRGITRLTDEESTNLAAHIALGGLKIANG